MSGSSHLIGLTWLPICILDIKAIIDFRETLPLGFNDEKSKYLLHLPDVLIDVCNYEATPISGGATGVLWGNYSNENSSKM